MNKKLLKTIIRDYIEENKLAIRQGEHCLVDLDENDLSRYILHNLGITSNDVCSAAIELSNEAMASGQSIMIGVSKSSPLKNPKRFHLRDVETIGAGGNFDGKIEIKTS